MDIHHRKLRSGPFKNLQRVRDCGVSVPNTFAPKNSRNCFKCHHPCTFPKHSLGDSLGNPFALFGAIVLGLARSLG